MRRRGRAWAPSAYWLAAAGCVLSVLAGVLVGKALGPGGAGGWIGATVGAAAAAALTVVSLHAAEPWGGPRKRASRLNLAQLGAELTSTVDPLEVARALEQIVERALSCERVSLELAPQGLRKPFCYTPSWARGAARWEPSQRSFSHAKPFEVPITFRGAELGLLRIGPKRLGDAFTSEDLEWLGAIADFGGLALAHALVVDEVDRTRQQRAAASREEREALVETLSAEITHEMRYPINFFRSIFERAAQGAALLPEDLEIGREEVDRLERLASGLRRVSRRVVVRHTVEIAELCLRAEALLRDRLNRDGIRVDLSHEMVRCDPDKTTQILVNLLANALDAAGSDGEVGVTWSSTRDVGELIVWDSGSGFGLDSSQLFAPWYTTKARGTGLGLAITARLVRAHGWTIEACRRNDRTMFIVRIPARDLVVPVTTGHSETHRISRATEEAGDGPPDPEREEAV